MTSTNKRPRKALNLQESSDLDQPSDNDYQDDDSSSSDGAQSTDDETGVKVVGKIAKAPTKGLVPPGQISKNTLSFLAKLAIPENNDREWFALHDPVFRQAQKEFVDFVDILVPGIMEKDTEIPYLPAKELIHRVYRDVRFSNDKTPYKFVLLAFHTLDAKSLNFGEYIFVVRLRKNFSVSLSRTGRKGIFGHYHLSIMPGNRSILAIGVWDPAKDELALIRQSMASAPNRFRRIISNPAFVKEFGEPLPIPPPPKKTGRKKAKRAASSSEDEAAPEPVVSRRRNVFGGDRELKVAPKGYPKDHPQIDLLKLRSVAVVKHYTDEEVTKPNFQEEILRLIEIARPLVHHINTVVTTTNGEFADQTDAEEAAVEDA